jgi:hypothetical protein
VEEKMAGPGARETEYEVVSEGIRFWSENRFRVLTVYFALLAGLVTICPPWEASTSENFLLPFRFLAIAVTYLFYALEDRSVKYFDQALNRLKALEKDLGYMYYTTPPEGPPKFLPTARRAVDILYLLVGIGWILSIVFDVPHLWSLLKG